MVKKIATVKQLRDEMRIVLTQMKKFHADDLKETADGIVAEMHEPGNAPTYPIKWDSEKQRRAFFASNGFGGGIPTVRRNAIPQGWKKTPMRGGSLQVLNTEDGAMFVNGLWIGDKVDLLQDGRLPVWQSKIHRGRWKVFARVARMYLRRLVRKIEKRGKKK
jgi:hypothetical protein